MSMTDEEIEKLIERLEANQCPEHHGCGTQPRCACADADDTADTLRQLHDEVKALREWVPANQEKPSQGERVLLAIAHEDNPVVGYWGTGRWEACTVNMEVSCGMYCYGGQVEGCFRSEEVIGWKRIPDWADALSQEDK